MLLTHLHDAEMLNDGMLKISEHHTGAITTIWNPTE